MYLTLMCLNEHQSEFIDMFKSKSGRLINLLKVKDEIIVQNVVLDIMI